MVEYIHQARSRLRTLCKKAINNTSILFEPNLGNSKSNYVTINATPSSSSQQTGLVNYTAALNCRPYSYHSVANHPPLTMPPPPSSSSYQQTGHVIYIITPRGRSISQNSSSPPPTSHTPQQTSHIIQIAKRQFIVHSIHLHVLLPHIHPNKQALYSAPYIQLISYLYKGFGFKIITNSNYDYDQ